MDSLDSFLSLTLIIAGGVLVLISTIPFSVLWSVRSARSPKKRRKARLCILLYSILCFGGIALLFLGLGIGNANNYSVWGIWLVRISAGAIIFFTGLLLWTEFLKKDAH